MKVARSVEEPGHCGLRYIMGIIVYHSDIVCRHGLALHSHILCIWADLGLSTVRGLSPECYGRAGWQKLRNSDLAAHCNNGLNVDSDAESR